MFADGTWQIDALQSLVHLRASVLGRAADCLVDVRSGTAIVTDGGRAGTVSAEIDLTTFRSGNSRRDEHVKSADFLEVARYPLATFTATWQNGLPTCVTGELRIRDVSAEVPVQITVIPGTADEVSFRANAQVSRRAFGVTRTRFVLADSIDVAVEGAARLGAAGSDVAYGDATQAPRRARARRK